MRPKVVSKTALSLLGYLKISTNDLHSLILYATTIKTAARVVIGIRPAHLPKKSIINNRTIA